MRLFSVLAVASAVIGVQAGICFDNFDCFFSGGNCVKAKGKLLGNCAPKTTKRAADAEAEPVPETDILLSLPIEARDAALEERTAMLNDELDEILGKRQTGAGGVCFDSFDCFFSTRNCVKAKGKLLGKCQPKTA